MSTTSTTSSSVFSGNSRYSADFQAVIDRTVAIASLPISQLNAQKTSLSDQPTALTGLDGKPLRGKDNRDSEGLALMANGDLLVSFERHDRDLVDVFDETLGPDDLMPRLRIDGDSDGISRATAVVDRGEDQVSSELG